MYCSHGGVIWIEEGPRGSVRDETCEWNERQVFECTQQRLAMRDRDVCVGAGSMLLMVVVCCARAWNATVSRPSAANTGRECFEYNGRSVQLHGMVNGL